MVFVLVFFPRSNVLKYLFLQYFVILNQNVPQNGHEKKITVHTAQTKIGVSEMVFLEKLKSIDVHQNTLEKMKQKQRYRKRDLNDKKNIITERIYEKKPLKRNILIFFVMKEKQRTKARKTTTIKEDKK